MPHPTAAATLLARSEMMSLSPLPSRFGVVVPVKPPAYAKSRLAPLGHRTRQALCVAFAVDTVTAALGSPLVAAVLAVTDDHVLAGRLAEAGATVIPDGTTDDLNGSLSQAAAELRRRDPSLGVVGLCADLPALRAEELTRVLAAVPEDRMSFVEDADGVGTTAVIAPRDTEFRPRFGARSGLAHTDAGAWPVDLGDVPSVRRDVDTPADLAAALELGVGPETWSVATGTRL